MDWLFQNIDPSRVHEINSVVAWHGRLMVFAWGILAPIAVMVARFGKIWPKQNWPSELDNQKWWRLHWMTQSLVAALTLIGLIIIWASYGEIGLHIHSVLGYLLAVFAGLQMVSGIFRGSKGGPTDLVMKGDHYDMTRKRIIFEWVHKVVGYCALLAALVTVLSGLWAANAPVWMFIILLVFWLALIVVFIALQRSGYAIDTYQAIWGPSLDLPGNKIKPIGWGIRREEKGE